MQESVLVKCTDAWNCELPAATLCNRTSEKTVASHKSACEHAVAATLRVQHMVQAMGPSQAFGPMPVTLSSRVRLTYNPPRPALLNLW